MPGSDMYIPSQQLLSLHQRTRLAATRPAAMESLQGQAEYRRNAPCCAALRAQGMKTPVSVSGGLIRSL